MANLFKIAVLVLYVLGAHAVPLVHQHIHHVEEASGIRSEDGQHENGPISCGCVSGCKLKGFRTPTVETGFDRCQLSTAQSRPAHSCGDTCAVCIAQTLPCGHFVSALALFCSRRPVSLSNYEPASLLTDVHAGLPGQRGPPVESDFVLLSV
jgi:hypothetical protein